MLRATGVFILGTALGILLFLTLLLVVVYHVPGGLNFYSFFTAEIAVGLGVGMFVGFLQNNKAELLAVACLLPFPLWSLTRPKPFGWAQYRLPVFLFGEILSLAAAFAVAHRISKAKRGRKPATNSG